MNNYEGIFIVKPDFKDDEVKNVFKAIGDLVTKNGGSIRRKRSGASGSSSTP